LGIATLAGFSTRTVDGGADETGAGDAVAGALDAAADPAGGAAAGEIVRVTGGSGAEAGAGWLDGSIICGMTTSPNSVQNVKCTSNQAILALDIALAVERTTTFRMKISASRIRIPAHAS
jgi:hypothetical protein